MRAISHSDRRVGDHGWAKYRLVTSIFIQYWLARQKVSRALVRIAVYVRVDKVCKYPPTVSLEFLMLVT